MKIALFGATGRVGEYILQKALDKGHSVKVLVRSPEKLSQHENLTIIQGDVRKKEDIDQSISGVDVVLSALGTEGDSLTKAIPLMIEAMNKINIKRIVTVGTAGILESRSEPGKLRYEEKISFRKSNYDVEEHRKMYDLLRKSELDWTIVCPTYLPDGDAKGNYRVLKDYVPVDGKQITVGDTAVFVFDELLDSNYIGCRVGIAY